MKLLIQHRHRSDEINGVVTSIREMLPALQGMPGVEARVMSSHGASWLQQWRAVAWSDVVMLNSNNLPQVLFARLLGRACVLKLHHPQYQSVHWSYRPMGFARRLSAEVAHLLRLRSSVSYIGISLARLAMRSLTALTASRVCACSRFCAEQAALPRRVEVLLNALAVPADLGPRTVDDLDSPPRFVFVGLLTMDKGWDTVLDAAATLRSKGRQFQVDIIGGGPDELVLAGRVAALSLEGCVRLRGRLEPADVQRQWAGALAAIVPSRFQEPAGYVAVEAASRQVAAIVSDVGGLPEVAGEQSPRFPAGDAVRLGHLMEAMLDQPEQALAIGREAYRRALDVFRPARIARELLLLCGDRRALHGRGVVVGRHSSRAD